MKSLLFLLLFYSWQISFAQKCSSPQVSRKLSFIYRTVPSSKIELIECFYTDGNPKNNYYDITKNCVTAAKTKIFIDKYGDDHRVNVRGSKVTLKTYYADADTSQNVVFLKSGKKCRYDAGFCYDSSQGNNYAVVWAVNPVPKIVCPNQLQQIFYGYVDYWTFTTENRKYLIYSVPLKDESFSLSLSNATVCHGKQAWYVDEQGFLVSFTSLLPRITSTPNLDRKLFPPFKSKGDISDSIIRDCTLKSYNLNFDTKIDTDYLSDSENLKIILKFYQQNIDNNKNAINKLATDLQKNNGVKGPSSNVLSELNKIKSSINSNFNSINKLFKDINQLKIVDTDIYSIITNLANSVKQLKIDIKNINKNDENLEKYLKEFKNDVYKKLNNYNTDIKKELDKVKQSSGSNVINTLNPTIQSLNHSSTTCINKVNSLKKDTEMSIQQLQKNLMITQDSLETNVKKFILANLTNIEMVFGRKLNDVLASANKKCDKSLNDVTAFKNMLKNDLAMLEGKLDKCSTDQKTTSDELNKAERALSTRISSSANDIKQLKDSLYNYVNMSISSLTNANNKDFSKELGDLKRSLSGRLSNDESRLSDVEKNVQKLRSDFNQKSNSLDATIQGIRKDILVLQGPNDELALTVEAGVLAKVIPLLNPTLITKNVSRELDVLKDEVAAQFANSSKTIKDLKTEVDSCKRVSGTKFKENEKKIGQIENNLSSTQMNLNDLSEKLNNGVLNEVNTRVTSALNKSAKCETKVKQLQDEINKLRNDFETTVAMLREEHKEFRKKLEAEDVQVV
ncbi:putative leucine-rich repeat-containing protein DDB_G0290503 [Diabrotica virgifera virgifera]|uniref:Leucine-rich repeat-containing protein DDB_G0290503 n=1 Tax=Diabrotica virgifera virgifera TaxID=50390 RepID=A0ABM5JIZ9_DIAVI|nr:putative leucine-rich repeat-containing protein DDB_G0290503 [Diabrotica virgifera virgifera]